MCGTSYVKFDNFGTIGHSTLQCESSILYQFSVIHKINCANYFEILLTLQRDVIIVIILVKFETNLSLYIQGRYKILIRNIADLANIMEVFEQSTITYYAYMVCTCEETMYVKNVYLQLSPISWYYLTMMLIYMHEIMSLIFLLFLVILGRSLNSADHS